MVLHRKTCQDTHCGTVREKLILTLTHEYTHSLTYGYIKSIINNMNNMWTIVAVNQHLYLFYWNSVPFFSLLPSLRIYFPAIYMFYIVVAVITVIVLARCYCYYYCCRCCLFDEQLRDVTFNFDRLEVFRKFVKESDEKHTNSLIHTYSIHMEWTSPVWTRMYLYVCGCIVLT